jgi:hypothetical protein
MWLEKATNFSNRILEALREKRNFLKCLCFVPNSLCLGYAHVILIRRYKVKWWDFFAPENKSSEFAVMLWLSLNNRHGIEEPQPLQDQSRTLFLA